MRSFFEVTYESGTLISIVVAESKEDAKRMCYNPYDLVIDVKRLGTAIQGVCASYKVVH